MPTYTKLTSTELLPWAENGETEQPSTPKIDSGWLGEEKPPHEYMNWWQNKVDRYILSQIQEGIPSWSPTFSYVEDSIVKGLSGTIFIAKGDSVGQDPELDVVNTYWSKLIDSSGAIAVDDITPYIHTLLVAVDASTAQTVLGGTSVGKALFTAADQAAARTAIGGSYFVDRANHSGVQPISSVTDLQTTLDARELLTNKATNFTSPNDTKYPTTLAVATYVSSIAAGEVYLGQWNAITNTPTLASSTGDEGDVWQVSVADEDTPANNTTLDGINDWVVGDEVVFSGGTWTKRSNIIPSLDTDDVTEATNLYFTAARVRGVVLTGISFASSVAITATDTVIDALGKLQSQITQLFSRVPPSGGSSGQLLAKNSGTDYDYTWVNPTTNSTVTVNDFGNKAVSGSESINLDLSANTEWNVSMNTANTTGTLTINLNNLPSTTTSKYVGYIRIVRGGRKTISFTPSGGKTWNWIQSATPLFTDVAGEYDVVMFYNMLGETKIHAMIVDTGVV